MTDEPTHKPHIDPISPISPEAITERQREVARLVAAGRTNTEIADELGITLDGAKYHVSELLTRLGLRRREEVAEWYRAHFGPVARLRTAVRGMFGPVPALLGGLGVAVLVVGVTAMLFVGLRGASDQQPAPAPMETASPIATEAAEHSGAGAADPYVRILEMVPDRDDVVRHGIAMGNPALGRALSGVDPSSIVANGRLDQDAAIAYITALPEPARHYFLTPLGSSAWNQLVYDSLGLNPWAIDQWFSLIFEVAGPPALSGATGAFESAEIRDALEACTQCEPPVVEDERNGWIIRGWGDDGSVNPEPDPALRTNPPLYDDLGFGGRIAFRDGVIVRSASLGPVTVFADTQTGTSLAENEDFRLLAEHLEEEQALRAELYPAEGWRLSESVDGEWAESLRSSGVEPLGPFVTWASGEGWEVAQERPYNILVLVHETAEQTERNADLLPARLEPALATARATEPLPDLDQDEVSTIEVETDGRVLVARITGPAGSLQLSTSRFISYLIASE